MGRYPLRGESFGRKPAGFDDLARSLGYTTIAAVIATTGLLAYTEKTITDPAQLRQELATIRQRGYAIDNGEQEEGVRCLAVPVYGTDGKVVAAISISGPSSRVETARIPALLPDLKRISTAITDTLVALQDHAEAEEA